MIITIDGPAGSGKSTAARRLATALGMAFLDTGATYRAVTLKALRQGVDLADEGALAQVARHVDIKLINERDGLKVLLDGQDVSREIRSATVSDSSSHVARSGAVRQILVELQRKIGRELGDFVTEGRDQGSVVFPNAELKFYVDAAPETRARRRWEELRAAGELVPYEQVLGAVLDRDHKDRSRSVGPLVRPDGAIVIDTSENSIEQTTAALLDHARRHLGGRQP